MLDFEKNEIRLLKKGEQSGVCELVLSVFDKCVAPCFSPEGVAEFKRFVDVDELLGKMNKGGVIFVACSKQSLIGVLELRKPAHICMFFIAKNMQRCGVGGKLLARAREHFLGWGESELTVNASPNAVAVYENFGFVSLEPEKKLNGIRFMPMSLSLKVSTDL